MNNVHGFITNTANYSALTEPYFKITDTVNGQTVRQSKWVDWNYYVDELSFAQAFRTKLVVESASTRNIGMLIDTSRNGWGGTARPDRAGRRRPASTPTSTVVASTAGSTPATGATRPVPASASGRRPAPAAGHRRLRLGEAPG